MAEPPQGPPSDLPRDHAAVQALARRVAAGDRVAAERFARILMPTVRTVTARLVANPADAADVAQAALVEALRAAGNYRGEGPIGGWAARIAARVACHWLRSAPARRTSAVLEHDALVQLPGEGSVGEALPRPLSAYLDALPEAQRTAFVLRHALEYTLPEIAELTGAPVPTVKSRILKALERIRQLVRRDTQLGARKDAS